jgi:TnpA family transposase
MLSALLDNNGTHPVIHQWKVFDQKLQVKHIQASIQLFLQIKDYFYELLPLLEILNLNKSGCEYYATWVSKAKVSQLIQMPDKNKLYLHLAAFAQHQFYARLDYLVDIFLKSVTAAKNKAKKKRVARDQAERGERLALIQQLLNEKEKLEALITEIAKIIDESEFSDQKKIGDIKILLKSHHAIQSKINIEEQMSNTTKLNKLLNDDTYYDVLESVSKSLQIRVSEIIKAVDFNADTSDKNIIEAINYYKKVDGEVDDKAPLDHLEKKHRDICLTSENKIRVSLYKILFFMRIMDCIKSGSLNLKYSYRYKAIQDYLTPKEKWMREKHQLLQSAGLSHFTDVESVLGKFKESLDERYKTVNENILSGKNKHIHFTTPGKFILHTPSVEKKNIDSVSDILGETGFVPIIHVLNDINRVADFTDCFKHYSVKNQKLKPTPTTIFAGIMAKGHNIGVNKISHISVGINENTLTHAINWFFTNKNIKMANNKIVAMINKLSLSDIFKFKVGQTHTASDGQKYQVMVDSLLANFSFKYFGKDSGITVYTFIDDQHSLFYSTVISTSEREAAYVIDGLLHNDVVKSDIHSTDMHGFTETMFAGMHFIGTALAPRFKNLSRQRIYAFSAKQTYENKGYKILPSRPINQNLIREKWDDILNFMTAIKLKETHASILFKRLSSYAKDHPLYKAIKEFGRIIKSQYILTYIDDCSLRQRIEKQLNSVELSNKFSKAVFFERNQEFSVGLKGEQEIAAGCKSLIQNSIVLWNYLFLSQRIINTKKAQDKATLLDIIRNGSMQSWAHVNMRGEYDFTKAANNSHFNMPKILALKIRESSG